MRSLREAKPSATASASVKGVEAGEFVDGGDQHFCRGPACSEIWPGRSMERVQRRMVWRFFPGAWT